MLEGFWIRVAAKLPGNAIAKAFAVSSGKNIDAPLSEVVTLLLKPIERIEHCAVMVGNGLYGKVMILSLTTTARQHE